jgi:transcriptional regulator of acetoin/glycerol metabolism
LAHRLAYFFATDRDPGGAFVCHRCDNPSCVRPDHLFLGTNAENMADCKSKGRNHIPAKALSDEQRADIRREYGRLGRKWNPVSLAHQFGVSRMTIYRAVRSA